MWSLFNTEYHAKKTERQRKRHRKTETESERDSACLSQGRKSTACHECWRGEVVVWIGNVSISYHAFGHIVCYILLLWLRYYFSHKVVVPIDQAWPAWLLQKTSDAMSLNCSNDWGHHSRLFGCAYEVVFWQGNPNQYITCQKFQNTPFYIKNQVTKKVKSHE